MTWASLRQLLGVEDRERARLAVERAVAEGGDYDIETLEETQRVRSWGGQARALPFLEGYSTTALIEKVRRMPV